MAIFDGVQYAIASALSNSLQRDISNLLNANGAVEVPVQQATHIITPTLEFEGAQTVSVKCVIVTPTWVERSQVLGKMQDPAFFSADEGMLFSGVHATTSGLTPPDLEKVMGSIQAFGGQFSSSYTRSTTHLITISNTSTKYIAAMGHRAETGIRIVIPHWLNDCTNIQRRLPEEPYEYPNPICLSGDQITKTTFELDHDRALLFRSLNTDILREPDLPTRDQMPDPQIWRGRLLYLSPSLNLESSVRGVIEAGIETSNGKLAGSVEDASILITRYREGPDYLVAHKNGITIGTLEWLKHVERTGIFHSPTDQLLHYPIPSTPVPGFSKHELTITNYTGVARDYLKKLINLMGARYTATLSADNTAIVAAYMGGAKTDKAREWSTPIVNHVWLEDCFLEWACLPPGQPKYIQYPTGVDWSVILGNKHLGRVSLENADDDFGLANRVKNRNWTDDRSTAPKKIKISDEYVGPIVDETTLLQGQPLLSNQSAADMIEVDRSLSGVIDPNDEEADIPVRKPQLKSRRPMKSPNKADIIKGTSDVEFSDGVAEETPRKNGKLTKPVVSEVIDVDSDENRNPSPKTKPAMQAKKHSPVKLPLTRNRGDESDDQNGVYPLKKATTLAKNGKSNGLRHTSSGSEAEMDVEPPTPSRKKRPREPAPSDDEPKAGPSTSPRKTAAKAKRAERIPSETEDDDDSPKRQSKKSLTKNNVHTSSKLSALPPLSDSDDEVMKWRPSLDVKKGGRENLPPKGSRENGKGKEKATTISEDESDAPAIVSSKATRTKTVTTSRKPPTEAPHRRRVDETGESPAAKNRPAAKGSSKGKTPIPIDLSDDEDDSPPPPPRKRPQKKQVTKTDEQLEAKPHAKSSKPAAVKKKKTSEPEEIDDDSVIEVVTKPNLAASSKKTEDNSASSFGYSRRAAATKAGEKLKANAEDMNQFKKEMANGRVRGTWEKNVPSASLVQSHRSVSRKVDDDGSDSDIQEVPPKKRKRISEEKPNSGAKKMKSSPVDEDEDESPKNRSRLEPKKVKIVTTQVAIDEADQKKMKKIGVGFIEDALKCTHLIVQKIGRTEKFLCAMAVAPFIVTDRWIKDSAKAGYLLEETPYLVKDPAGEDKWNFKLAHALKKSKAHRQSFLKGHTFFVTKNAGIDKSLLRNIIIAHGGDCFTQTINQRNIIGHSNRHVVSDVKDKAIWGPLAKAGVPIYVPELVVTGVLVQEMDWDSHRVEAS